MRFLNCHSQTELNDKENKTKLFFVVALRFSICMVYFVPGKFSQMKMGYRKKVQWPWNLPDDENVSVIFRRKTNFHWLKMPLNVKCIFIRKKNKKICMQNSHLSYSIALSSHNICNFYIWLWNITLL